MSGSQSHGFDLVVEFPETVLQEILGAVFDKDHLLCRILADIGLGQVCGGFQLSVAYDRPADVSIPAGEQNVLDMMIRLGQNGTVGSLRLVAGMEVDHQQAEYDLARINLLEKLYCAHIQVAGITIPGIDNLLASALKNEIGMIKLLPDVRVYRDSTLPGQLKQLDLRLIDDTSSNERDALGILFTFGGGQPGDLGGFSESFLTSLTRGGVVIGFDWLLRILCPKIEEGLEMPAGSFEKGHLKQTVRVDKDNEIDLTALELFLADGAIKIKAKVQKTGFCYKVTGEVSASLTIEVQPDGNLVVDPVIGDPDLDLSIPWYCYVAAALLTGLLVGFLFGVLAGLIAGVIVPLLMYVMVELLEGTVENITTRVTDTINDLVPGVSVPAVGINLIFERVSIDDIHITARVEPVDGMPPLSSGVLFVPNNSTVDLETGIVTAGSVPGSDLLWEGVGMARRLVTVGQAGLALTGSRRPSEMNRYRMYQYLYHSPGTVAFAQIASRNPVLRPDNPYLETGKIIAVRTSGDHYAWVQGIEMREDGLLLAYVVFESAFPWVYIDVLYKPVLAQAVGKGSFLANPAYDLHPVNPAVTGDSSLPQALRSRLTTLTHIGLWSEDVQVVKNPYYLTAVPVGLKEPVVYTWQINGLMAKKDSGVLPGPGAHIRYERANNRMKVELDPPAAADLAVTVSGTGSDGVSVSSTRTVHYEAIFTHHQRAFPSFASYQKAYMERYGINEVPVP